MTKPPGSTRAKKLFPKDWLEVCRLAELGKPVKEIAAQYDVDESVLYKGLKKRRVNVTIAAVRAAAEEAEKTKTELLVRIRETKKKNYDYIRFTKEQMMKYKVKTIADGGQPSVEVIKAYRLTMDALLIATKAEWMLLGLDHENANADAVLPELPITELSDAEVEQMRLNQAIEEGNEEAIAAANAAEEIDDELEEPEIVDEDEAAF